MWHFSNNVLLVFMSGVLSVKACNYELINAKFFNLTNVSKLVEPPYALNEIKTLFNPESIYKIDDDEWTVTIEVCFPTKNIYYSDAILGCSALMHPIPLLIVILFFSLQLAITLLWMDPRLQFDESELDANCSDLVTLKNEFLGKIWKPDVFFYNIREASVTEVLNQAVILRTKVNAKKYANTDGS